VLATGWARRTVAGATSVACSFASAFARAARLLACSRLPRMNAAPKVHSAVYWLCARHYAASGFMPRWRPRVADLHVFATRNAA